MAVDRAVSAERVRRRRAVYTGLRPFLGEAQLLDALLLWSVRYADGPAYALHGFVSAVCTQTGLEARHGEVYRSLMRALTADEAQLLPDPGERVTPAGAAQGSRAQAPDVGTLRSKAAGAVFVAVAGALLDALEAMDAERALKVRVDVMDRLGELHLPPREAQAVNRWLMQQTGELAVDAAPATWRDLLHRLYVRACELFGPVATDRVLGEAVTRAGRLPAAQAFPPRDLL
ncbi:MAG: hypothetical protein LPK58_00535 [Gammaproteobacteria bacterium]|nr:hypothetical protein [Gammaproteobacteria bacterium]MDX5374258.1 hypothetical protein [Gammaproteobacteria bacterium]